MIQVIKIELTEHLYMEVGPQRFKNLNKSNTSEIGKVINSCFLVALLHLTSEGLSPLRYQANKVESRYQDRI